MTFKIAVLQMKSQSSNKDKNTDLIINKMKEASENKADIILIPECFITGYNLPIEYEEALDDNSIYLKKICKAAEVNNVGVVATTFTKGNKKPQNTAFIINKNGNILLKYSKVHTCDFADEFFLECGEEFRVCDFHGVKIGVMICYDREYPESARVLMMKGAELILVPNDCESMQPRVQALSTRAYENMVGVVMANPNGENAGCSCAFSPICWDENGKCVENKIFIADEFSEGIYYAEFNMEELRAYREREMMGNTFRKVRAYEEILSDEIVYPFKREQGK